MPDTLVVKIPPRFYWDHVSRDLQAGTIERDTKRAVYVRVDRDALAELLADARYYAYEMGSAGFDDQGLIASARATVRALEGLAIPIDNVPADASNNDPDAERARTL